MFTHSHPSRSRQDDGQDRHQNQRWHGDLPAGLRKQFAKLRLQGVEHHAPPFEQASDCRRAGPMTPLLPLPPYSGQDSGDVLFPSRIALRLPGFEQCGDRFLGIACRLPFGRGPLLAGHGNDTLDIGPLIRGMGRAVFLVELVDFRFFHGHDAPAARNRLTLSPEVLRRAFSGRRGSGSSRCWWKHSTSRRSSPK